VAADALIHTFARIGHLDHRKDATSTGRHVVRRIEDFGGPLRPYVQLRVIGITPRPSVRDRVKVTEDDHSGYIARPDLVSWTLIDASDPPMLTEIGRDKLQALRLLVIAAND
jgi:hypothetical protein